MKDCSSLEANSFPPDLQMADVHTFSVDHIVATLSNSMNSIENSASPILAPHDINYLLNLSSEYLFDSGVWQQFDPNPQVPLSSALLGVDPPSALILPHLGFGFNDEMDQGGSMEEVIDRLGNSQFRADDQSFASDSTECSFKIGEENGWRGLDGSTNTAFGLDLTKKNKSLVATSCQASLTSDSALAGHPKTFSSFCNSRFSQLQTPDKSEAMGMGNKHTKASNSPPMATRSGVRPMQPVYQSAEEYQCGASPKNSSSPGHNLVQNFCPQLKEAETGKKRKETSQCDEPRKERKTDDMKIKGQKISESSKEAEEIKKKEEPHTSGNSGDSGHDHAKESPKPPEPPKLDYIHVRARRGQATDSHSLAERIRREKISERMKCLQDLVPGCRKVSRKALMLDEIINYVQSLQCQVELLSMKLAAVNHPRLDFSLNSIFPKELLQGYISPPTFAFNHELISNLPLLGSAQAKLNQLGVRSMGGLNSRSQTRSNPKVLGGNIFRDVNSQTGLELSRTASVANPNFNDQMHVQHLKTEL